MIKKSLYHFLNKAKNKTGAIAIPLVLSVTGLPLAIFVGYYATQLKKVQLQTDQFILFRESIHAAMKYTLFGVERKRCFNDNWSFDENCDRLSITNTKSSERLLLSDAGINYIRKFKDENCEETPPPTGCSGLPEDLSRLKLSSISQSFSNADLKDKETFVLSDYFKPYTRGGSVIIRDLTIIVRNKESEYSSRGREKHIEIESITNYKEKGVSKQYSMKQIFSLHPREVNMFSLILAKDMYFYKPNPNSEFIPAQSNDDRCIPPKSKKLFFKELQKQKKRLIEVLYFKALFL